MVVTVASTTPARKPPQPAWAMPRIALRAGEGDGAQSAVSTAKAAPLEVATAASADVPPAAPGPFHDNHPGPVHLIEHGPGQIDDGPAPFVDSWTVAAEVALGAPGAPHPDPAGQLPVGRVRTGPGVHHLNPARKKASRTSRRRRIRLTERSGAATGSRP